MFVDNLSCKFHIVLNSFEQCSCDRKVEIVLEYFVLFWDQTEVHFEYFGLCIIEVTIIFLNHIITKLPITNPLVIIACFGFMRLLFAHLRKLRHLRS